MKFFRKKKKGFDLDKVLGLEDTTQAIITLDDHVNQLSDYGVNLSPLSQVQKVILFVENLEREINNGGFSQFYWNSSGDYAQETLQSLKTIGAQQAAQILAKANATWPKQHIPADRSDRQDIHEKIEEQAKSIWEQCDTEFYQYPDDIAALLLDYVKKNKGDF